MLSRFKQLRVTYWQGLDLEKGEPQYEICEEAANRFLENFRKKQEYKDKPYLHSGKYLNYIKLSKLDKVVNLVGQYARDNSLIEKDIKILDAGCGVGVYSRTLAELGFSVTGVDVVDIYIAIAKKRAQGLSNVEFLRADATTYLKGHSQHFNIILALDVIEHMKEPDEFIRSVYQGLTSPGIFIVIIPYSGGIFDRTLMLSDKMVSFLLGNKLPEGHYYHIQKLDLRLMKEKLLQAGFKYEFVSSVYTGWGPFWLLFSLGFRNPLEYLNTRLAKRLPPYMTGSWILCGIKN